MTAEELNAEAQEYLYDRLDPQAIDSISTFADTHIEEVIVASFKAGYNKCKTEDRELIKDLVSELDYLSELSGISYALKLKEKTERFLKGH